jgi:hypothetical protein
MLGCSWLLVTPPPPPPLRTAPVECTTDRAAPVADTVLAGASLASAIYLFQANQYPNRVRYIGVDLFVAMLWISSAGYGYSRVAACEAAQELASMPAGRPRPLGSPRPAAPPPSDDLLP